MEHTRNPLQDRSEHTVRRAESASVEQIVTYSRLQSAAYKLPFTDHTVTHSVQATVHGPNHRSSRSDRVGVLRIYRGSISIEIKEQINLVRQLSGVLSSKRAGDLI